MAVNRRQLRALCRKTLRQLRLWPPLDVDLLRDSLAEQRGKPIDLVPVTDLPRKSAFGFTGGDETLDVIMYEAKTARTHQVLIILHEFAHMILNHPRHAVDHSYRAPHIDEFQMITPEALAEILGTRPPTRQVAGGQRLERSLYDDPLEWEAETMATIMLSWVPGCGGRISPPPADPFEAILRDTWAW